jgi:hypothetical protein
MGTYNFEKKSAEEQSRIPHNDGAVKSDGWINVLTGLLILRYSQIIQRQSKLSITTTYETGLLHGKICSFVTQHQTMPKPNLAHFVLFQSLKDCLNCDVITS